MANVPLHIPALLERNKFVDYRRDIAGDSFSWSWERSTTDVMYLAIHHSAGYQNLKPKEQVDAIGLLHTNPKSKGGRGWGGVGYHFIITTDGVVWYVGDVSTARANVANQNEKVIGICLVGDFTKHNPTDDQILSAHDLCSFLLSQTQIWPRLHSFDASVRGHKEFNATACPGSAWKGPSDSISERIKNRIPYSPIITPPPSDPDKPPVEMVTKEYHDKIVEGLNKKLSALESWTWQQHLSKAIQLIKGEK